MSRFINFHFDCQSTFEIIRAWQNSCQQALRLVLVKSLLIKRVPSFYIFRSLQERAEAYFPHLPIWTQAH